MCLHYPKRFQLAPNSEKSVVLLKITVCFILSPNFQGNTNHRVGKEVVKHDQVSREKDLNTLPYLWAFQPKSVTWVFICSGGCFTMKKRIPWSAAARCCQTTFFCFRCIEWVTSSDRKKTYCLFKWGENWSPGFFRTTNERFKVCAHIINQSLESQDELESFVSSWIQPQTSVVTLNQYPNQASSA